jgi:hypothetical protein
VKAHVRHELDAKAMVQLIQATDQPQTGWASSLLMLTHDLSPDLVSIVLRAVAWDLQRLTLATGSGGQWTHFHHKKRDHIAIRNAGRRYILHRATSAGPAQKRLGELQRESPGGGGGRRIPDSAVARAPQCGFLRPPNGGRAKGAEEVATHLTVDGSTGGEDREVVLLGAILTPIHSAVALRPCV